MRPILALYALLAMLASADTARAQATEQQGPMAGHVMGSMSMGSGMMMGHGMSMRPAMVRLMIAVMDTDGDGMLSIEEMQTAHARMFRAMDADKDGKLTADEIVTFVRE